MKFFEKIKNYLKKNKPVVAFLSLVVFLVLITFLLNIFNKNKIIKKGSQYIAANSDFRIDFEKHKNDNNKIRFARRIKEKGWFGREKQLGLEFEVLESNLVQYNQIKINRDQSQFNDLEMDNQLIPSLNEFDLATSEAWLKSKETRKLKAPKFDFVSNQKLKIADVFEGVEIDYSILKDNGLKEEIIINGKDKFDPDCFLQGRDDCLLNHNQYKFQLTLDKGLSVETDSTEVDGKMATKYNFVDEAGNIMFYFAPLFAIDNGGDVTYNVSSSLVRVGENDVRATDGETQDVASLQGGSRYVFTLTVDPNWFFDSQRSYPIIIDPTILTTEIEHQGTGAHFNTHVSTDTDKIALDIKHNLAPEQQFDDYDYRQKLNYAPIFIDNLANPSDLTDYQINFTNPLINEDGLVLSLHFDEGEGLVARDSSGNYNDGAINGATWTTDARAGKGLSFDGVDDCVVVSNKENFDFSHSDHTISLFFKCEEKPLDFNHLIDKFSDGTPGSGYVLFIRADGFLRIQERPYIALNYDNNVCDGSWHKISYVADLNNKKSHLYFNGKLVDFHQFNGISNNLAQNLRIGCGGNEAYAFFDGNIDEVKIYNRALSDEEIQALYYLQKPNFENIQFVDSDRNTKLNYWKENDNSFWVKVPEIKANSKKTIYSYLDENVKTSESNGDEVFDFFDDFNGAELDAEKWEIAIKEPASVNVDNGLLELNAQNLTAHSGVGVIGVNQIPNGDYVVQARAKRVNGTKAGEIGLFVGLSEKVDQDLVYYGRWTPYSGAHLYEYTTNSWRLASRYYGLGDTSRNVGDLSNIDDYADLWIDEKIIIDNANKITKSEFNYPNGKVYNLDSPVSVLTLSDFYPMIHLGDSSINSFSYVDKYFVRKYTPTEPKTGTVVDVDGNVYSTVTIGNQTWLQQNLKVTKDPNGQAITRYCYNDDPANCEIYGGLYDWNTVMNGSTTEGAQGICPDGYHVPTDAEWHELESFLTDEGETCDGSRSDSWDCNSVGQKLKSNYWDGTDTVRFNSLPGGSRGTDGNYVHENLYSFFWSSNENDINAWQRRFYSGYNNIGRHINNKLISFSLRCIQNSTCEEGNCSACSVGDKGPAGGVVFYKDAGICYEAPKFDQSSGVQWGCQETEISGADGTAIGTGYQNTKDILNGCASRPIAASVCDGFVLGEKTDWFLPSKDELNEMYMQKDVIGGFDGPRYFTSSENNADVVRYQYFETGVQDTTIKSTIYAIRCARRF